MSDAKIQQAIASNTVRIGSVDVSVHVLDNGMRVIDADDLAQLFRYMESGVDFTDADTMALAKLVKGVE